MYINQKKIKPIAKPFIPSARLRELINVNIQITVNNNPKFFRLKKSHMCVYKIY